MGPEVTNFEKSLATFAGARHALACAHGQGACPMAPMDKACARWRQEAMHACSLAHRGRARMRVGANRAGRVLGGA
jgi:hypothetical protein